MKFTLAWLKDHLDTDASLEAISEKLSSIGLEVDGIDDPGEKLGAFVIARILEAKRHPDADRLQVCQVEIAKGTAPVEVVCGAPNARAGLVGVFAPLGTYIPGTGITLEKRPVRGVVSNGMMVSERELQLSEDHEGIIDLEADLSVRVGERYIDVMGINDPVIEVGLTPNRPDCTGVRGIARDLAAAGLGTLKPEPELGSVEGTYDCPIDVLLEFDPSVADACPIFAARFVKGIRNGPAPEWMQRRLVSAGLRPISALVDITNYISLDRGRPLHVYDADKLTGAIRARLGRSGEKFRGLDGKIHEVDDTMCVIADDSGPLGLGGIVGGEESSCTEATQNVLIESAYFDPKRTAATGRKLSVVTDARYRFERGVDPAAVEHGLDLATDMILRFAGGEPSKSKVAGTAPVESRWIEFDTGRIATLAGLELTLDEVHRILHGLGFETTGDGPVLKARVPTWRPDIHGAADLVEEVVRIAGLDRIPSTPMPRVSGVARAVMTEAQQRSRRARRVLAGRGLVEAITWSFIPRAQASMFGGGDDCLELENPISVEMSSMRPSLLPGLLSAAQRNRNRGFGDAAIFEVGQAYRGFGASDQLLLASGVRCGTAHLEISGRYWARSVAEVDVYDAKADAMALIAALGIDAAKLQITTDAPGWFHPGKSGTLRMGPKNVMAHFGEVHPSTLRALDVDAPVVAFEVFLNDLPTQRRKSRAKGQFAVSDLLPVKRDLAFIVDDKINAGDVVRAAGGADRALVTNVELFDVFAGGSLEQGYKSLAIEITLQPKDSVLTQAEIDAVMERVVAAVGKATGGKVRA
ncbi:MAG: hypothetical protein RLZ98_3115 [Pseudomonadota bacterium]|jgi:phenylalanyl-tRNA synthetase beta chain